MSLANDIVWIQYFIYLLFGSKVYLFFDVEIFS